MQAMISAVTGREMAIGFYSEHDSKHPPIPLRLCDSVFQTIIEQHAIR